MANSYSAPNFNIDTSCSIDTATIGLEAIKGGAVAAGDKIYVYNGATLTINKSIACLQIIKGQTSAGAAGAGNRYGIVTINPGITVAFDGNATNTNSGILCNPTSADNSSKGCALNINGTAVNPVIFTNAGGALATAQRYTTSMQYGTITASYWSNLYTWLSSITALNINTSNQNAPHNITRSNFSVNAGATYSISLGTVVNNSCFITFCTIGATANNAYGIGVGTCVPASGFVLDLSGCNITNNAVDIFIYSFRATNGLYINHRFSFADIRPTVVVPTTPTITNLYDGTIKFTVANIASVAVTDMLVIYDSSNNIRGAISAQKYIDATERKPANCIIIGGVALSSLTGWYAKYTSDFNTFSVASDVAGTVVPSIQYPAVIGGNIVRRGANG